MRIAMSVILVALSASQVGASDYYVSPYGSNNNPGTLAKPFLTIQQAASAAHAGDQVLVRGGTYRETVNVTNLGTAAAPIAFRPYQNEQVTITGLDRVSSNWAVDNGNIYSTTLSSSANTSQVFVNGQMMTGARWPNGGYNNPLRAVRATVDTATTQSAPQVSTLTDSALAGAANMSGAKMAINSGMQWYTYTANIDSHADNKLSYQWNKSTSEFYAPKAGNPYHLYGTRALLDTAKEWHYDPSSRNLSLYAPGGVNPSSQVVEVRNREVGFNIASSHVNVSGFRMLAATINVGGGGYNTIDNCQILYPTSYAEPAGRNIGPTGVLFTSGYNTLHHSEIAYAWGSGLTIDHAAGNIIDNNVIHDVDWGGTDSAFINIDSGTLSVLANNTMYNAGRSGINFLYSVPNVQILNNDISRYGALTKDLGGIYTYQSNASGTVIAYNRVHDSRSAGQSSGIYMDNGTHDVAIHHNLVTNSMYGMMINMPGTNEDIHNNTLWGVTKSMTTNGAAGTVLTNVNTTNNLSNSGVWVGTNIANNINTTTNPFNNSAAGDYTLKSGSGIPSDVGAFEYGVTPWTAGANWKTWTFANQSTASLVDAVSVRSDNIRTTTGSLVAGKTSGSSSSIQRAFFKFDLSNIENRPITGVTLRIYENAVPNNNSGDVTLYRVTSNDWTNADANFNQSVDTSAPITGFYDWSNLDLYTDIDVTAIVLGWLSDPSTNFGFSLRGSEDLTYSAKYFDGLYGTTAPELVFTYVPEPNSLYILGSAAFSVLGAWTWRKRRRFSRPPSDCAELFQNGVGNGGDWKE